VKVRRSGASAFRHVLAGLSLLALAPACTAAAPPTGRSARPARAVLQRLSWHPRKGTTEIDCHDPGYDCDKVGLEKCESECAGGEMPDCVALGLWQHRNVARGGEVARGLALLRLTCDKGYGPGCVALAAQLEATPHDRARITAALAPACDGGDPCGCVLRGAALTFEPGGGARGVELLGDSCARGVLDACDEIELIREICERDHSRESQCARITAALRPPWSPPRWPSTDLPAALEGCFRLAAPEEPPDSERCVSRATAEEHGWSTEPGQVCPTDGSFDPGALYCFFQGQYFVKPPQGPWDAHPARWAAPPDKTSFRRRFSQRNEGDGAHVEADQGYLEALFLEGGELYALGDGAFARLDRLAPPDQLVLRAAVAALPSLDSTCDKAYRCSESLHGWSGHRSSTGLCACLDSLASDRARIEKELGTEAAKDACR
jgi:hypothetical protein